MDVKDTIGSFTFLRRRNDVGGDIEFDAFQRLESQAQEFVGLESMQVLSAAQALETCKDDVVLLMRSRKCWEYHAAGILFVCSVLKKVKPNGSLKDVESTGHLIEFLGACIVDMLFISESRLQSCFVVLIEQLARLDGDNKVFFHGILPLLSENIDIGFISDSSKPAAETVKKSGENVDNAALSEKVILRNLEIGMHGFLAIIVGHGVQSMDRHVLTWRNDYIFDTIIKNFTHHDNRFVREVGYDICAATSTIIHCQHDGQCNHYANDLSKAISVGLEDNWSQVRYAASVAVRRFITGLKLPHRRKYYSLLVPRMCLNRYYLAEGVRNYSQETWTLAFPGEAGVLTVCENLDYVTHFYCTQAEADNHGVREAACHCIAELSTKVEKNALKSKVKQLLKTLLGCFRDDSWPVRDAASVASGRFIMNFPTECKDYLEDLLELWFDNLSDNIWSVRENAALALGNSMEAYPSVVIDRVVSLLPSLLNRYKAADSENGRSNLDIQRSVDTGVCYSQKSVSPNSSDRAKKSTANRVVKGKLSELHSKVFTDDPEHTDQQLFSCGSLAPKLQRRNVGCMNHTHNRPKFPWEYTHGAIYLLRELSRRDPSTACDFLDSLADLSVQSSFIPELQALLWNTLPDIFKAIGKRPFMRVFNELLPRMILCVDHENQLASSAAADCVLFFRRQLGTAIFSGRVDSLIDSDKYWRILVNAALVDV